MKILNPQVNLSTFFDHVKKSRNRVLLLDYDGTLAPFAIEPHKAIPYPGVLAVLERLVRAPGTRLVLISGRSANDLVPLLSMDTLPEIWGCHGGERLKDGSYQQEILPETAATALDKAAEWVRKMGWNAKLERKTSSIALHWRGMPQREIDSMSAKAYQYLPGMAAGTGLSLHRFDGGVELRPDGITKGKAARSILADTTHDTTSAYLGDDLTDEDAFEALKGHSLTILVRDSIRPTAADVWLKPPEELLDFLGRFESAVSGVCCD